MFSEILYKDLEFWNNLSYKLDITEIRILELIYNNKTYTLDNLIKDLKNIYKINNSKPTIIKKSNKLRDFGIIELIKGKPLMINEIIGIENNMNKLLIISKERYRLK